LLGGLSSISKLEMMKILFLCGSLEPGKDGVGDYVRVLGKQLSMDPKLKVAALSLNDSYVRETVREHSDEGMQFFRLPPGSKDRYKIAQLLIKNFEPDWISIQFVPYSFHPKGVPLSLAKNLKYLLQESKVHLMIHETWVGTRGFQLRSGLTSFLQKLSLKRILITSKPQVVHTHLPEYLEKLNRFNLSVKKLPLFSNIDVRSSLPQKNKKLVLGFFSQMDCNESVLNFLKEIGRKAKLAEIPMEVLLIGGQEDKIQKFSNYIQTLTCLKNRVRKTGFLANHEISLAIHQCSMGVTPLPRHALGKSGSVAAFLSHGIPVAAPHASSKNPTIGFFSKKLQSTIITTPELHKITRARKILNEAKDELSVPAIAKTFLRDLISH